MSNITPVSKLPFKLYPLNKSSSGKYSYYQSSPIITFEFSQNELRLLKSGSLFLCGRMRIKNRNKANLPGNRFDLPGSASTDSQSWAEVCYMDDRIGVNAVIDNITVGDLQGSIYEQAKNYNRNLASVIGVTHSYKHMCSFSNMALTSAPNNDVYQREVSSDMEFALSLSNGFFRSNTYVPLDRGIQIKINLASDNMVLFGKDAQNYVYELQNIFLMGDYIEIAKPRKSDKMQYVSYHNFHNVMNSSNDHQNINLNLSMVNNLYHNFVPATWSNNFQYDSFSTCPLLNKPAGSDYQEALIKRYTVNRSAIRFPLNFAVDETVANTNGSYQTIRSREYLNAIFPYHMNKSCALSADSEDRPDMFEARTDWLKTPQSTDQGLVPSWQKVQNQTTNDYEWQRTGDIEKSANLTGIGSQLDPMHMRAFIDYTRASYNYNIESELDATPTNTFVFGTAITNIGGSKSGQLVAST